MGHFCHKKLREVLVQNLCISNYSNFRNYHFKFWGSDEIRIGCKHPKVRGDLNGSTVCRVSWHLHCVNTGTLFTVVFVHPCLFTWIAQSPHGSPYHVHPYPSPVRLQHAFQPPPNNSPNMFYPKGLKSQYVSTCFILYEFYKFYSHFFIHK